MKNKIKMSLSYLGVSNLPALVQPECPLAISLTLWLHALLAHLQGHVLHRVGHHLVQFLQMHHPVIRQHPSFPEDTVHVALELLVLVDVPIAELPDRL